MRAALVGGVGLATGMAVAIPTGFIAFVGLAAPHLVRSAIKTTHGQLICCPVWWRVADGGATPWRAGWLRRRSCRWA